MPARPIPTASSAAWAPTASLPSASSDSGNAAAPVFFLFDLLHLDAADFRPRPLIERKDLLAALLAEAPSPLHYSDHQLGHGRAFHAKACAMSLEGIVSKRADAGNGGQRGVEIELDPKDARNALDAIVHPFTA